MKIVFTREDKGVSVVTPVKKDQLEKVHGKMTIKEYKKHIYDRCVPDGAKNIREIKDTDLPSSREFRDAWVDVTDLKSVDIDCRIARDIKLKSLRSERDDLLLEEDKNALISLESGDGILLEKVKSRKKYLREITDPLKALDVEGKVNDKILLQKIRDLSEVK